MRVSLQVEIKASYCRSGFLAALVHSEELAGQSVHKKSFLQRTTSKRYDECHEASALGWTGHAACESIVRTAIPWPQKIGPGVLCVVASLGSAAIWLFDFAGQPLSMTSLFWAGPMLSAIAFLVYLRSEIGGTIMQAVLYALSCVGAYRMIEADCAL